MGANKRLLILSVSAGAGHVRAAQAIEAAARVADQPYDVTHIDLLTLVPKEFRKLYGESYIKLVERLPQLWSYLYSVSDRPTRDSTLGRVKRAVERLNTRALGAEIEKLDPAAIVCTHFLPAELLSRAKGRGRSLPPVWVQVTDFDVHGLWVHPHVDAYCVASEEIAFRLADRGIPREQIHVTGIPVMPQFSATLDRAECARELGLSPNKFTVLMMAGGAGVGSLDALAERLLKLPRDMPQGLPTGRPHDFQIVALAGRNAEMLKRLQKLATKHPGKLFPLGFTTTVERVMTTADLVVTKPGGLSVSECLALAKPMLLISPIPGQEERNADYLLEAGAAVKAMDLATLEFKLETLRAAPERLRAMSAAAARIAAPQAASSLITLIKSARATPVKKLSKTGRLLGAATLVAATTLAIGGKIVEAATPTAQPTTSGNPAHPTVEVRPTHWAEPIKLDGVKNLHRITPMLYRSEQPTAEGMRNLEKLGIRTVINLRYFNDDKKEIRGTNLRSEHTRILTWRVDDKHVIDIMRLLKRTEHGPFLIHCQHGADRTGLMSAMYRILEQGWSKEDALKELTEGGFGYHSVWKNIRRYVRGADVDSLRASIAAGTGVPTGSTETDTDN